MNHGPNLRIERIMKLIESTSWFAQFMRQNISESDESDKSDSPICPLLTNRGPCAIENFIYTIYLCSTSTLNKLIRCLWFVVAKFPEILNCSEQIIPGLLKPFSKRVIISRFSDFDQILQAPKSSLSPHGTITNNGK